MGAIGEGFIQSAKMFEETVTHDRAAPEVRKALRAYDPTLDLLYSGLFGEFYVVSRVRPGEGPHPDGYPFPLFGVGHDPRTEEVLLRVDDCSRRHVGRGREMRKRMEKAQRKYEADTIANALPGFGEYGARLRRCDDNMTMDHMARDMHREAVR